MYHQLSSCTIICLATCVADLVVGTYCLIGPHGLWGRSKARELYIAERLHLSSTGMIEYQLHLALLPKVITTLALAFLLLASLPD